MSRGSVFFLRTDPGLWAVCLAAALAGCTVGPDYQTPALSPAASYGETDKSLTPATAFDSPRFSADKDVPARWWKEFGSAEIDRLVNLALQKNPDLASARAALRASQATLAAQRSALYPQVGLDATASRQRNPLVLASPLSSNANNYSLYTGQLSIAYAPDVFGGIKRQIEAATAQTENQKFAVEAAYLTLTTNVVVAAIQLGALRAQVAAAQATIKSDQDILDALALQVKLGEASSNDAAAQEAVLAQAKAALPPLRKQLGQQEHLLAQLTGRTPGELAPVTGDLDAVKLPAELPLSLPANLVVQRPDVRAAAANVHTASAAVGVAIANRLPNLSLSAAFGGTSTDLATLFSNGNAFWGVTGGITQTVFDAGALREQQHAAEAQLDQAKEAYRSTVLTAFQNVADTLLALNQDSEALAANGNAEQAARKSLDLARAKLREGEGNTSAVLLAEQAWQSARSGMIQAQAARYADAVALFQALGGGWWHRGETDLADAHLQ